MKNYYRAIGVVVVSAVLLASTACDGPPPKPAEFNNRIAKNNKRLFAAARTFRKAMEPLQKGTPVTAYQGQAAYDELYAEVKKCIRASKHMPVTRNSSAAPDFLEKYQDFMDLEDDIMQDQMKRVVDTLDAKISDYEKWVIIDNIFKEVANTEAPAMDALQKAQKAFCGEHNLQSTKQL